MLDSAVAVSTMLQVSAQNLMTGDIDEFNTSCEFGYSQLPKCTSQLSAQAPRCLCPRGSSDALWRHGGCEVLTILSSSHAILFLPSALPVCPCCCVPVHSPVIPIRFSCYGSLLGLYLCACAHLTGTKWTISYWAKFGQPCLLIV